ncbi:MAG: hypothetical protein ACE5H2_03575 [Terriglobia bacterium]
MLNPVQGSASEGWLWRADANYNTLIGILNTDTDEASVAVSLDYYADGLRYSYQLPDLGTLAGWCRGRGTTYVFFNNMTMFDDARRFQRLLAPTTSGLARA